VQPPWTYVHLIWHCRRGRRRNDLWQIFWWSVDGCRFCRGSKIALSNWQSQASATAHCSIWWSALLSNCCCTERNRFACRISDVNCTTGADSSAVCGIEQQQISYQQSNEHTHARELGSADSTVVVSNDELPSIDWSVVTGQSAPHTDTLQLCRHHCYYRFTSIGEHMKLFIIIIIIIIIYFITSYQALLIREHETNHRRHFFATRVINIWNFVPEGVVNFTTLWSFKNSFNSVNFSRFLTFSWLFYFLWLFSLLFYCFQQATVSALQPCCAANVLCTCNLCFIDK